MTDQPTHKTSKAPALNIYTQVPNGYGDNTRIGAKIGVAFQHKDGEGYNIVLDAQPIPLNGQIRLVGFPPKSDS